MALRSDSRLQWYVGLERAAFILAVIGSVAIFVGVGCLPFPIVSAKAMTSLFPVLSASGSLAHESRLLFAIGAMVLLVSGAVKLGIRALSRAALVPPAP
jgi:hypothetical protein